MTLPSPIAAALLAGTLAVACSSSAPRGASPTDPNRRGAYVGMELGIEVDPATEPPAVTAGVAMPEGTTRVASRHAATGDVHAVVGARGADLIVLLTDDDGTVLDDFTLVGAAAGNVFSPRCSRAGILLAMLPRAACATPAAPATPRSAWGHKAGALVELPTAGLTCDCP